MNSKYSQRPFCTFFSGLLCFVGNNCFLKQVLVRQRARKIHGLYLPGAGYSRTSGEQWRRQWEHGTPAPIAFISFLQSFNSDPRFIARVCRYVGGASSWKKNSALQWKWFCNETHFAPASSTLLELIFLMGDGVPWKTRSHIHAALMGVHKL